jgi:hypothetical protein
MKGSMGSTHKPRGNPYNLIVSEFSTDGCEALPEWAYGFMPGDYCEFIEAVEAALNRRKIPFVMHEWPGFWTRASEPGRQIMIHQLAYECMFSLTHEWAKVIDGHIDGVSSPEDSVQSA